MRASSAAKRRGSNSSESRYARRAPAAKCATKRHTRVGTFLAGIERERRGVTRDADALAKCCDRPKWDLAQPQLACYGAAVRVRFPYYAELGAREKRSYRRSDAVGEIALPDVRALRPFVRAVDAALGAGRQREVARATTGLVRALLGQLGVGAVRVVVRSVRPRRNDAELHGQYSVEEGTTPVIEVWMRTAAQRRVVAFRTFLRTLLHELGHHLDLTLLGLEHTLHTEGFFRRESSLVRQLLGPGQRARGARDAAPPPPARGRRAPAAKTPAADRATAPGRPEPDDPRQLRLPF